MKLQLGKVNHILEKIGKSTDFLYTLHLGVMVWLRRVQSCSNLKNRPDHFVYFFSPSKNGAIDSILYQGIIYELSNAPKSGYLKCLLQKLFFQHFGAPTPSTRGPKRVTVACDRLFWVLSWKPRSVKNRWKIFLGAKFSKILILGHWKVHKYYLDRI